MEALDITTEHRTEPVHDRFDGIRLAFDILCLHSVHFSEDARLGQAVIDAALYTRGERTAEELRFARGMAQAVVDDIGFAIGNGGTTCGLVAALFTAQAVVAASAERYDHDVVLHNVKKALHYDKLQQEQIRKVH